MIRRYGAPPRPGQRYRPRSGVYAILPLGGRVLLTYQAGIHQEYQLTGGGIDPGESPLQALHREMREELGWSIASPRRIGTMRRFVYMPEEDKWAEKIRMIYLARPARRISAPLEADHRPVWLSRAEALEALPEAGDRAFLAGLRG